jgi:hypothetical protein
MHGVVWIHPAIMRAGGRWRAGSFADACARMGEVYNCYDPELQVASGVLKLV